MIKKLTRAGLTAIIAGAISFLSLSPLLSGRTLAAPGFLPPCGQDVVGNSGATNSSGPDIARSNDYVAVVWSNGEDDIMLGYTGVATTSTAWTGPIQISTSIDNKNPTIAFDPNSVDGKTVYIAYQNATDIKYVKCTLDSCSASSTSRKEATIEKSGSGFLNLQQPQIVVVDDGPNSRPVIVYQGFKGGDIYFLRYAFLNGAGDAFVGSKYRDPIQAAGGGAYDETSGSYYEQNPSAAYAGDKVHIGFTRALAPGGTPNRVGYFNLDVSGISGDTVTSSSQSSNPTIFQTLGATETKPDFSSIAALDGTVALVWQWEDGGTPKFAPAYNISYDDGQNWQHKNGSSLDSFRYIPTNSSTPEWRSNTVIAGKQGYGVKPDVTLHMSGTITVTHVAWHDDSDALDKTDIRYSYLEGGAWHGTPILSSTTPPITETDMTYIYNEVSDDTSFPNKVDAAHNARILFDNQQPNNDHRLQVVYIGSKGLNTGNEGKVLYNGWIISGTNWTNPDATTRDADCDLRGDYIELPKPADYPTVCSAGADYFGYGWDCEGDLVPDALDSDSDNDSISDMVDKDPLSPAGGVYLPIILKNA